MPKKILYSSLPQPRPAYVVPTLVVFSILACIAFAIMAISQLF